MIKYEYESLPLDNIKGKIPYPCCPHRSAIVSKDASGKISVPCPNCGRFVLLDPIRMTAKLIKPCKGATARFSNPGAIS